MKGISPTIAVVLLTAIALTASVGVYFFTAGISTSQPTPTPATPITAVAIDPGSGNILISNLGTTSFSDTFYIIGMENKNCTITVAPGEQGLCTFTDAYGDATGGFGGDEILVSAGGSVGSVLLGTPADNAGPEAVTDFTATSLGIANASCPVCIPPATCTFPTSCTQNACDAASLTWTEFDAGDLGDFASYKVYQNDTLIETITNISDGTATGTASGADYNYTIRAVDNEGNEGELASSEVTVCTEYYTACACRSGK